MFSSNMRKIDLNRYLLNESINNSSDIYSLSKDDEFMNLINSCQNKKIKINSRLVHMKDFLTSIENLIYNIDQYISFVKNIFRINQLEVRYIVRLTLYNNPNIMNSNVYFYDNEEFYLKYFKQMLISKYKKNAKLLRKYNPDINIYNFEKLTSVVNNNTKPYILFEDINLNNIDFYLTLWDKIKKN